MKLEYLGDGSLDCPLIRLYDFQCSEAARLKAIFDSLAKGSKESVALHDMDFISPIGGCKLVLRPDTRNRGIARSPSLSFECAAEVNRWDEMAELTERFVQQWAGQEYNWLDDDGEVSLLLSPSGLW